MLEGKKIAVLGVGMVGKALISGLVRSHIVSKGSADPLPTPKAPSSPKSASA